MEQAKQEAIAPLTIVTSPDRRIRRTRKALRLALQHLLSDGQLDQISIRDIADEADISYTTFFRHYGDKEALLDDLAASEMAELLDLTLPIFTSGKSFESALTLCEAVKANDRLWTALLAGGAAANIRASFIRLVEERSRKWPAVSDWLPPGIGTPVLCGITLEVLGWWLGKAPHEPPEKIAGILDRFFTLTSS